MDRAARLPKRLSLKLRVAILKIPATAQKAGIPESVVKKNPTKPDALYERAVDMQPNEVFDFLSGTPETGTSCGVTSRAKDLRETKPELVASMRILGIRNRREAC